MPFPERLLPSSDKNLLDVNEGFSNEQLLARYHDPENGMSIIDGNKIDPYLIDYHRFPGLSCNYLPPSNCDDLKIFYHNKDLLKNWTPEMGDVSVDSSDYEVLESREVYKFPLESVISKKLPYEIGEESHWLQINVVHKPLLGNYPHCEFELIASHKDNGPLEALSKKKKYHRAIIANLRRIFELNAEPC